MNRRDFARAVNRGFFGIGICGGKTPENLGTLWRSATLYGASFVFTVGRRYRRQASDTGKVSLHTPLHHYADITDLVEHLPQGCCLVGVELDVRATPLAEYQHLIRCCYLLGAEDRGLSEEARSACHQIVQVETLLPYSMNVAVAGSVLLYDRYVKSSKQEASNATGYRRNSTLSSTPVRSGSLYV